MLPAITNSKMYTGPKRVDAYSYSRSSLKGRYSCDRPHRPPKVASHWRGDRALRISQGSGWKARRITSAHVVLRRSNHMAGPNCKGNWETSSCVCRWTRQCFSSTAWVKNSSRVVMILLPSWALAEVMGCRHQGQWPSRSRNHEVHRPRTHQSSKGL